MADQLFELINTIAESPNSALMICLAMIVVLSWGWWRREQGHVTRYDTLRSEWITRENAYLESLGERDNDVSALGRETFTVLQDVAMALAGMERTLDSVDTMVHMVVNRKLRGEDRDEKS